MEDKSRIYNFLKEIKTKSSKELNYLRTKIIRMKSKHVSKESNDLLDWMIDELTDEMINKALSGE